MCMLHATDSADCFWVDKAGSTPPSLLTLCVCRDPKEADGFIFRGKLEGTDARLLEMAWRELACEIAGEPSLSPRSMANAEAEAARKRALAFEAGRSWQSNISCGDLLAADASLIVCT